MPLPPTEKVTMFFSFLPEKLTPRHMSEQSPPYCHTPFPSVSGAIAAAQVVSHKSDILFRTRVFAMIQRLVRVTRARLRDGRLARVVGAVAAVLVAAHRKAAQAGRQEVEWVRNAVIATSVHAATVGEARSGVAVAGVGESSLSTAVETTGLHAAAVAVAGVHWRVGRCGSAHAGRNAVGGWWATEGLAGKSAGGTEATSTATVWSWTRSTGHRRRTHSVAGRCAVHAHAGRELADDGGLSTASSAAETVDVLGEVVVVAPLDATAPVASTEWNGVVAAATHAMAVTVAHVPAWHTHHAWVSVAVTAVHWRLLVLVGRVRAAEASSATLKVGEAAGWAGPVTWARPVLAGREGGENIRSAVKNARGGRSDLDSLLVQSTSVHTQRFRSLGCVSLCLFLTTFVKDDGSCAI